MPIKPTDARAIHSAEKMARLLDISVTLSSTLDYDELLQHIIETAADILECEGAAILLYEKREGRLYFAASTGSDREQLAAIPVPIDRSIAGAIYRENKAVAVDNTAEDARHYTQVGQQVGTSTRNLLGVPMRLQDQVIGVLEAINKREGVFNESDAELLLILASQAAVAIQNARLLEELKKANEELGQLESLKSNFMAITSHELRTPLTAVLGYADIILHESGGASGFAREIVQSARQMESIVDSMTKITELHSGYLAVTRSPTPSREVLEGSLRQVGFKLDVRQHQITIETPEPDVLLDVDPDHLIYALMQVIRNAVQFTKPGQAIRLAAQALDSDKVMLSVEDSGIGLHRSELESIFAGFYQVEALDSRTHEGLGLGLTLAREIIELYGGQVWAESPGPGAGATIKIVLPRA